MRIITCSLVLSLLACSGGENVIEKQDNTAPLGADWFAFSRCEILEGYIESLFERRCQTTTMSFLN